MTLDDYKAQYGHDDAPAPGWQAIETALEHHYGDQSPYHWGTLLSSFLGGNDPLDGISAYRSPHQAPHFHYCSYGFSALYFSEEDFGQPWSGFGFELTLRLNDSGEEEDDLAWVADLFQHIARYVFAEGKGFQAYHYLSVQGPICHERDTALTGLAFVRDPELGMLETPHGQVECLQMVGLTTEELEDIQQGRRSCQEVIDQLRQDNPLLITDLNRRNG